eukprot:gene8167-9041_t
MSPERLRFRLLPLGKPSPERLKILLWPGIPFYATHNTAEANYYYRANRFLPRHLESAFQPPVGAPAPTRAYPPSEMFASQRLSSFQPCPTSTSSKQQACCHDRFCTMRQQPPWYNSRLDAGEPRSDAKPVDQMRRMLMSMEASHHLKGNKKNPLDMLARLFPKQSMRTLKRMLERCQGDPVFAIERILDRYPGEMDVDDVAMTTSSNERQERRLFGSGGGGMVDAEMVSVQERRIHGVADDHLSKIAMAYDIPLSLGKSHRGEDSSWEQQTNANHTTHASNVHTAELAEKRDR